MKELLANYILNDGEIVSLNLSVNYKSTGSSSFRQASIQLLVRKKIADGKWEPCLLKLDVEELRKAAIAEEFEMASYSDIILKRQADTTWYFSLDPFGNSGEPHENDNMVLVATSVAIAEGVIHEL